VIDATHPHDEPLRTKALPLPTLEQLYTLLPLALIGVVVSLAPTQPYDFWWHLHVGRLVAEQGIPHTNMWAWSVPADAAYVYAAWLGNWLFYQAYLLLGLTGPVLLRSLLGVLAFGLVAAEARRRSGSWRLAGLAVLLAGAMTINNLSTRPQNWSWPLFAAFVLILGAYVGGQAGPRTLAILPALMAFWVNAHGAFVLGGALVGLFAVGETLRALLKQPGALAMRRLGWLYLAGAGVGAAMLLNPSGPGIVGYVLKLLGDAPIQTLVSEWQPPVPRHLAGSLFFLTVLALVVGLALGPRRPTLTDTLVVCALLWLAFGGMRSVVWFGMAAMPVLAGCLAAARGSHELHELARMRDHAGGSVAELPSRSRSAFSPPLAARLPSSVIALGLLAMLVAVQPPFKAALPLPAAYIGLFADVPGGQQLFTHDTPAAAAAYLREHPGSERLFADMAYASYLVWAVPEQQVFIDARIELYPLALWHDYVAITQGRDLEALLVEKHGVERVLLNRTRQRALAAALAADPAGWTLEYSDERAEIYRRNP
jgi:hypothetical protein